MIVLLFQMSFGIGIWHERNQCPTQKAAAMKEEEEMRYAKVYAHGVFASPSPRASTEWPDRVPKAQKAIQSVEGAPRKCPLSSIPEMHGEMLH